VSAGFSKPKKKLADGKKGQMNEPILGMSGLAVPVPDSKSVHGKSADGGLEGFDGSGRDRKHSQSGPETIGPACKPENIVQFVESDIEAVTPQHCQ
jgi:hypothetical protein